MFPFVKAKTLTAVLGIPILFIGTLTACNPVPPRRVQTLTIGLVSYEQGVNSVERYREFQTYLGKRTQTLVQLEPALNELNALDRIQQQSWQVVFAPPGLAAIAMDRHQYLPLLKLQGEENLRSVLVVREDSDATSLVSLSNRVVALGQPGSATGYYLPLYDLYGLTLSEIRFAPTPKTLLSWVADGSVAAGALSEPEFQRYRQNFPAAKFRILHTSRTSPAGLILVSPTVSSETQVQIQRALNQAEAPLSNEAGYQPNAPLPNYQEFIRLVNKVKPIESNVRQKPARLTVDPL